MGEPCPAEASIALGGGMATLTSPRIAAIIPAGVVRSRWAARSSKPVWGGAEPALVGSTPIHSR